MRKTFLFMMTTLDGYMEGPDHDISWHNVDEEFNTFAAENIHKADTILFGRRTYQLMESFWPSPEGLKDDPIIAQYMNETPKIVFSHTLNNVVETDVWKNVTLLKDNVAQVVNKLKGESGKDIIVLGSNNLSVTLLEEGLLDEVQIMVAPVVIGNGTPLFAGLNKKVKFDLMSTRKFGNGNILLTYTINK